MSIFDTKTGKTRFADIIAPITEEDFFQNYYDKQPLHIPADKAPGKLDGLMNWQILNDLLNMTGIWSSKSLALMIDRQHIPPAQYCEAAQDRSGNTVLQPRAEQVMQLLQQGASLVANDIDSLTPQLRAASEAFEEAFDARVQANLYCSWQQRQAFNSHFDTHDVFALHVEGEKVWRVYETRMPHPIRHRRFETGAYQEQQHETQRGKLMMEVPMRPGDILYLPRGWYHDALAASGGTVHIAFGVTGVIGLDVVSALMDFAVEEEAFRTNLPCNVDGTQALAERAQELGQRLAVLSRSPDFVTALKNYQKNWRYARGGMALPIDIEDQRFDLSSPGFKVQKQGSGSLLIGPRGGAPIPPGREKPVSWMIRNAPFNRSAFLDAHKALNVADLDRLIGDMIGMGVLRKR